MQELGKVGGIQEVFVQLDGKAETTIEGAIQAITRLGGKVMHAYPPYALVVSMPSNETGRLSELVGKHGILSARTGAFETHQLQTGNRQMDFAVSVWNQHINLLHTQSLATTPGTGQAWDAPGRTPPTPPLEILEKLRQREAQLAPHLLEAAPAGAPNFNIPVLVSRIAVGLVYVDSTVSDFQITDQEKSKVLGQVTQGLNMLSGFEPRANISWFYDLKRPKISLAASQFTDANKDSWEDMWRDAALGAMGYSADLNGMNAYIQAIQSANSAQWAYAVFVTKYPKTWFAYEWANHVVMDFQVDGWGIDNFYRVIAHETSHVFGASDEYTASGCNCTDLFGRYQILNGNCQSCNASSVPCLMVANTSALCDFTRGHLGWNELAVFSQGSTILKGTWTFDFDTGTQGPATGADIWWEQVDNVVRFLVPQSGAMLANLGKPNFDSVSVETLSAASYTATPITGSDNSTNQLTTDTVVAIRTSDGHYAKMKVNGYGYNMPISWVTYR